MKGDKKLHLLSEFFTLKKRHFGIISSFYDRVIATFVLDSLNHHRSRQSFNQFLFGLAFHGNDDARSKMRQSVYESSMLSVTIAATVAAAAQFAVSFFCATENSLFDGHVTRESATRAQWVVER